MEFKRVVEGNKSNVLYFDFFFQANFNGKYEKYMKNWGGGIMSSKSQAKTKPKERLIAKEAAQMIT